jgi:methanogenic corrinoid protein MtbC1
VEGDVSFEGSHGSEIKVSARHTIAVVSRRTGISQLLLRAWERRYEAVDPERTPTGRRLYSDSDIKKLSLLNTLTNQGHRIGDIASLSIPELEHLLAEEVAAAPEPAPLPGESTVDEILGAALQAVEDMDEQRLEGLLVRASVVLSRPALRRNLLHPLMMEIGERWRHGDMRIAQEHMATAIVKAFLSSLTQSRTAPPGAPCVVVTTPAGQLHELGALMAASQALEAGFRVSYLGPNLPAEEIAAAVVKTEASAVLLSLIYPGADPGTVDQLRTLRRCVGPDLKIMVGGQAARSYLTTLQAIGAPMVDDPAILDRELSRIAKRP